MEPVDHIERPLLPWREHVLLTECGINAAAVKTISRVAYFDRLKDFGSQRTAILTCMTCAETARRWKTWDEEPRHAIEREVQWEISWGRSRGRGDRFRDELLAIASLVEAHRDEFDAHISATEQRRAWLEQKAEHAKNKASRARRHKPIGGL